MTRISKQAERRHRCPKKLKKIPHSKSGPKKDALAEGYKIHKNALQGEAALRIFIPKM